MEQSDRSAASGTSRFGYNGKLKDNDVKGEGNSYDYGFRMYDPRVARFLSIDPDRINYPWQSPYLYAGNKPITFIDQEGTNEQHYLVEKNPTDGTFKITCYKDVQSSWLNPDIHYYWYNGNQYWFGRPTNSCGAYPPDVLEPAFRKNPDAVIAAGLLPNRPYDLACQVALDNGGSIDVIEEGCTIGEGAAAGIIAATQLSAPTEGFTKTKTETNTKIGDYSNIKDPKNTGPSQNFTKSQKKEIKLENMKRNGGQLKSDISDTKLDPSQKNIKGQKANKKQAEVDHKIPKAKGGSNHSSNAQVISREENLKKGKK